MGTSTSYGDDVTEATYWTDEDTPNATTLTNATRCGGYPPPDVRMYRNFLPPMMIFCVASVTVNITVLVVSYWIKRPLSATLHISLSLAGADACTSLLLCIGLFINSYLPVVHQTCTHGCVALTIEVLRLSGVIVTVAHLLALAINHYVGIIKPLHYPSIVTTRKRTVCIVCMWILPILFFVVYFSAIEGQGFQSPGCQAHQFLKHQKIRITYASLFFLPLVMMTVIYTHIFVLVYRNQTSGTARPRCSQGSRYVHNNGSVYTQTPHQQRDITRSVKAIKTTLLILGSFIVGLMPAVVSYVLICDDCLVHFDALGDMTTRFCVFYLVNFLVIFKTMINPVIYAARMNDIKTATAVVKARLCRRGCCRMPGSDRNLDATFYHSSRYSLYGPHGLSQHTDTTAHPRRSHTVVCRMSSTPYQTNIDNGSMRSMSSTPYQTSFDNGLVRSKQLTRSSTKSHQRRRTELTLV